jgi:formylmethanofuran dehydrogenase subunit E
MAHSVKIREQGKRAWFFVNPRGEGVRLRVHATMFPDKGAADAFVAKYAAENSDLEFKVVEL